MARHGDICSCVPQWILLRHRGALLGALVCALALGAMPSSAVEESSGTTAPQVAVATPAETEGSSVPAAVTAVKEPGAAAARTSDQQRRVLMLLLMNSAGPVRPFGNLGR